LCFAAVGDDNAANSDDLQDVLSAIGETDLTATIALQQAIMQSQMLTTTSTGINDTHLINMYCCPACEFMRAGWLSPLQLIISCPWGQYSPLLALAAFK